MTKFFLIIVASFLFLNCNKQKDKIISEKTSSDSLAFYMKNANNKNNNVEIQIIALDKGYLLLKRLKNTKKNRDTLFNIMFSYYNLKDWTKFKKASKKLLKDSEISKDSINLAKVFRYKGGYFKRMDVYDSSFIYYLKAEKFYLKLNDQLNLANNSLNKGIVQYAINDYLGAELSLTKAYYIFKDSDDKNKLYGTLNQLGLVCNELKEYERAADYHLQALAVVKDNNLQSEEHQEAVCYNNLGYLYIKQKNYKKASENFELGLKDKTIINDDPELYSSLIDNLAYCRLQINDDRGLPKLFFDALEVREKLDNYTIIVGSYIHLSEYYAKKKDDVLAVKYSNEALKIARNSKIPINVILALKQASNVDIKNSTAYTKDYIRISDSLQVVERNSKDRFARIQLETDELKRENSFLAEENRTILNYFFGSVIIFGFLMYMRNQRTKNRYLILEQAQQKANEDIYRLIISQQDKVEEGKLLEKSRIAKEIHDGILGRLFGLRLNLDGLNHRNDKLVDQERVNYLNELKLIEQDLREISHELSREKKLLIHNFVAILNRLFDQQIAINKSNFETNIDDTIDWDLLSNTTKINLYRIIQESFQNTNKYAKAKSVKVTFKKDVKGNLNLTIFDDGIGFDEAVKSKGIGLNNIIERVQESLGTIQIVTGKNKGTLINITVPLESKNLKT